MPPKGKSKALTQKQSYLGKFTQNARNLEQMKLLIEKQEKEKIELERTLAENQKEIQKRQSKIKTTSRKLLHKAVKIKDLESNLEKSASKLNRTTFSKNKLAFSISLKVKNHRRRKPTTHFLSHTTRTVRRSQTFQACSAIHGVSSSKDLDPLIDGMIDTLTSKVKSGTLAKSILSSKQSLINEIEKRVLSEWKNKYYKSEENILRSLNVYYSHNVMGKAKYRAIRKANKNDIKIPNYVPYSTLAGYINELDIGTLYDVKERYGSDSDEDVIDGVCRSLAEYALRLVQFYIKVNINRRDKLMNVKGKQDQNAMLFLMAIGGDGAPGSGTAFLISFLNVVIRIASSSENFLLFGSNVAENSFVSRKYILELVSDIKFLESKTFQVDAVGETFKVEFKLAELPNDMKMLYFLAGELSNSAYYFSTFANVNTKNCNEFSRKIGNDENDWHTFKFDKRLKDAEKSIQKAEKLSKTKTTKQTQRSNLTSYIGQTLNSRQVEKPLVSHYIGHAKSEPLHLKNNVSKEMFMKLLHICFTQSNIKNAKTFKDIDGNELIVCFLSYIRKEMGCNYLSKKVEQWFNENGGKIESTFTFRFRGKESFSLLKNFPELLLLILEKVSDSTVLSRIFAIHFQLIQLRKVISYSVRITNFNKSALEEMRVACNLLFKACCLTENRVSPSLWTLCCAAPCHAKLTLDEYGLGLGVNTMEGREQKHQKISKYANNSTFQNRWPMIFRHEFIQLIHLRENGFDDINYTRRGKKYVPDFQKN